MLDPTEVSKIDAMSLTEMLRLWRTAPVGDPMFEGAIGVYFKNRMCALRDKDPQGWTAASKSIGW